MVGLKKCLGFTYVVDQLSFSIVPSILAFGFSLNFGVISYFLGAYCSIFGAGGGFKSCFWVSLYRLMMLYHVVLSLCGGCGGGIPSNYLVSTQLQLWLFCCWGCGCCWAVTITEIK